MCYSQSNLYNQQNIQVTKCKVSSETEKKRKKKRKKKGYINRPKGQEF